MVFEFLRRSSGAGTAGPEAAPISEVRGEAKAAAVGPGLAGSFASVSIAEGTLPHLSAQGGMRSLLPGGADPARLVRSGFAGNPVGYRCVRLISEAAAFLPLTMGRIGEGGQHPLLRLLARPNTAQGRADFLEALYGQILLYGNGWVEAVPAEAAGAGELPAGLPAELHVLRADRMTVVPGADGWPVAYDYAVGGRRQRYLLGAGPDPVCHIRSFHPQDDHYGLAPMQAAAVAVEVHNAASHWSRALLDNAARPSGAIVYQGADGQGQLSADQYDRLVSEMEQHHQGARNAGRPMLLEGGLDWKPMGFSPSDMEFHETKLAAAREIALAFGVPPMVLGIPGDATYANYAEANRAFYRLTVLPLAQRVLAALSHWLAGWGGLAAGEEIRPDPEEIPALAGERDLQWKRIGEAMFLTAAEKRALLGLTGEAQDG